jgi:hypothetical protein
MIVFQVEHKEYRGTSALEIVLALQSDSDEYPHTRESVRKFLRWSLDRLADLIHPREMDLSDSLDDETLALTYLHLRDEYGAGKLLTDREA